VNISYVSFGQAPGLTCGKRQALLQASIMPYLWQAARLHASGNTPTYSNQKGKAQIQLGTVRQAILSLFGRQQVLFCGIQKPLHVTSRFYLWLSVGLTLQYLCSSLKIQLVVARSSSLINKIKFSSYKV
jgi:hypothetical protein